LSLILLSTRQRKLIDLLLEQNNDITVATIAEYLGTSSRTIHRELVTIEEELSSFGISLLKKSGSGIRINGTDEQLRALKDKLNNKLPIELNAEERRLLILCTLLEQHEPIKLFSLAHDLNVTMPTISADLDELEQIITSHHLHLIRRRGYGVELTGHEIHMRKLLAALTANYVDEAVIINQEQAYETTQPITNQLLRLIGHTHFKVVEELLWTMQDELPIPLKEQTYTRLLLQISIAITRYLTGHSIQKQHVKAFEQGQPLHGAAEASMTDLQVLDHLLSTFPIALPSEEKIYIRSLTEQAFQYDQQLHLYVEQAYLTEIIEQLSLFVEQHTGEPISGDSSLIDGLLRHLLSKIERIANGLPIRNPMLAQIKKDYLQLFTIVSIGVKQFLPHLNVPDEEIGYITMHYGAAIERIKQLPHQLRAVIVCMSGIGSSKLLAIRLNKEFPQIKLIGHYSWFETARLPEADYDFIISTVDLPINQSQYIKLSPLVTEDEITKLELFMKTFADRGNAIEKIPSSSETSSIHWLQQIHYLSNTAVQIINQFSVYSYTAEIKNETIHQILPKMLLKLKLEYLITDIEIVAEQLAIREMQGSIVLPDTDVALLHTRTEAVTTPILALYRFDEPILLRDDDQTIVQHILVMLAPRQLDKFELELLSEISAMLLLPEMISALQSGVLSTIKAYISSQLENYIKNKLNWSD